MSTCRGDRQRTWVVGGRRPFKLAGAALMAAGCGRELKAAGIVSRGGGRRIMGIDYNSEIAFEKKAPAGVGI